MSEIDFGKLVSRVLARMDAAESERIREENTDPYKAMQMYKRVVAEEIRQVFEEAEAAVRRLVALLAEDTGMARDCPGLQAALDRFREEQLEKWDALVRMLTPRAKA